MTRSRPAELLGSQRPRLSSVPAFTSTASGDDAVDLALSAGLVLDPWQAWAVQMICSEVGNRWAAFEAALILARQNGKGAVIEARELAGLFLFGEVVLHSTHHFRTTRGAFNRLTAIVEGSSSLSRKVKRVTTANGNEGIEVRGGAQLAYVARSKGSGRGLSPDVNVIDEAFDYPEAAHTALMPTMSARPNPQILYTSTPPDENEHPNAVVLSRLRARALAGEDPSLLWLEWSVAQERYEANPRSVAADPHAWAESNPALGYRLTEGFIEKEHRSMSARGFAVERLGIGYWPDPDPAEAADVAIDPDVWASRRQPSSVALDPVALALDVSPARVATLTAVGWRADGRLHGEVIDSRSGTDWVLDVLLQIVDLHDPGVLVLDGAGPAGSLLPEIRAAGLEPQVLAFRERAQADRGLVDDLAQDRIRVVPCTVLDAAAEAVTWRTVGDAQLFDRRRNKGDISPVVSLSLGRFGLLTIAAAPVKPPPASPVAIPAEAPAGVTGLPDLTTVGF